MSSSRPLYMGNIVNGGALRSALIPSLALFITHVPAYYIELMTNLSNEIEININVGIHRLTFSM